MKTHGCAVPGCYHVVPFEWLMCAHHWRMVPRDLQLQVYATWQQGKPTPAYFAARARAIDAVPRPRVAGAGAPLETR